MNWFKKISSLDVTILNYNSYGDLELIINGRTYRYNIIYPHDAQEIATEIKRSKGSKLSKLIRWLDQYRIQE